MFEHLDQLEDKMNNKGILSLSIFYHDIIYNTLRKDNEERSALCLKKRLEYTSFPHIKACMTQIKATKKHLPSTDTDINYLLDIDLSILGTQPEAYQSYTQQIRQEYRQYPLWLYNKGRRAVLAHFLSLPSIYKTPYFLASHEQQARANLAAELTSLGR
jgi:Uncharacterized protein conserved in bacteria